MQTRPHHAGSSEQTRQALIRAALELFGGKGFDGTSTREIAAKAKANIASIAYHFGGKEGLRNACADFIVETIRGAAARAFSFDGHDPVTAADPDSAAEELRVALETMAIFVTSRPEMLSIVQFILREMAHPTSALDRIYTGVVEPVHRHLCQLWEAATGEPAEEETTRITVFTLIGQVLYFRIGREVVMRRMNWQAVGPRESAMITAAVINNLDAMLRQHRGA
ncbi:CerR family C-terminal domain-containing protein [Aquibium sp. LZ166]|uniref:CerR family C-terminal domain-containing protein n=1 Tax=Aquibium pacificus TaxID=3153579 RepID=A0ABV3SPE0_9HYPH